MNDDRLALTFRGVRGSVPTADARTRRFGGNTTCLEVVLDAHRRLLIDCGTGLRPVESDLPTGAPEQGLSFEVFLTHYHLDHILGLPYFKPLYDPRNRFVFYGHGWGSHGVQALLEGAIRPPLFPVALGETASSKSYVDLDGPVSLPGLRVSHARLNHPQGVTAYRLDRPPYSIVFATDHERGDPVRDERLRALCGGVDVLIHDAQYTPEEYERRYHGWGHSTWRHAVDAARQAGVRRLILFHHDPDRSDPELEAIEREAAGPFPAVQAAREGMKLWL